MKLPAWAKQGAQITILLAALAVGGLAVADRWTEVRGRLDHARLDWIVLGFALIAIAEFAVMMSWRGPAHRLRQPPADPCGGPDRLPQRVGQVPAGQRVAYLAHVQMGRRYDVPGTRSAAVSVLTVLLSLIMTLLLAAAILPWAAPGAAGHYWPVFLAVPVLVALLHPKVIRKTLTRALRLARRPPSEDEVTVRGIAASAAWSTLRAPPGRR